MYSTLQKISIPVLSFLALICVAILFASVFYLYNNPIDLINVPNSDLRKTFNEEVVDLDKDYNSKPHLVCSNINDDSSYKYELVTLSENMGVKTVIFACVHSVENAWILFSYKINNANQISKLLLMNYSYNYFTVPNS